MEVSGLLLTEGEVRQRWQEGCFKSMFNAEGTRSSWGAVWDALGHRFSFGGGRKRQEYILVLGTWSQGTLNNTSQVGLNDELMTCSG